MTFPALNESFMHLPCVFNRLELDLSSYGSLGGWGAASSSGMWLAWERVVPRVGVCGGRQRTCFTCDRQGADLHREYFGSTRNILALQGWAQSFPGQGGLTQCWWEQRVSSSGIVREAEELPGQLAQACSPQHVPGMQWDCNQPVTSLALLIH